MYEDILDQKGRVATLLGYRLMRFFQKIVSSGSWFLLSFRSWEQACHLNNLVHPVLPFDCHQVDSGNAL
jgi:hypothetical protein